MEKMFRYLAPHEIDVRIGRSTDKGVVLLLYKDARCDQNILDETVGPLGWRRRHEFKNGCNYCTVSLWDVTKTMWVDKEDVGTESNTEKIKGESSDAFKRACFNWGIGRELYTAPFVFVRYDNKLTKDNAKYAKFSVDHIAYNDEGCICELIVSHDGRIVYTHNAMVLTRQEKYSVITFLEDNPDYRAQVLQKLNVMAVGSVSDQDIKKLYDHLVLNGKIEIV